MKNRLFSKILAGLVILFFFSGCFDPHFGYRHHDRGERGERGENRHHRNHSRGVDVNIHN